MKNEPEIVKILREEEKLGKLQFYIKAHNKESQTISDYSFDHQSYDNNGKKISHRVSLSKKNLLKR